MTHRGPFQPLSFCDSVKNCVTSSLAFGSPGPAPLPSTLPSLQTQSQASRLAKRKKKEPGSEVTGGDSPGLAVPRHKPQRAPRPATALQPTTASDQRSPSTPSNAKTAATARVCSDIRPAPLPGAAPCFCWRVWWYCYFSRRYLFFHLVFVNTSCCVQGLPRSKRCFCTGEQLGTGPAAGLWLLPPPRQSSCAALGQSLPYPLASADFSRRWWQSSQERLWKLSSVVKRLPLKLGPGFLPPAPQGQEPRRQNKADESAQPRKGALRLNERRHNSAECSERAGGEPCSLRPGGRHGTLLSILRQCPAPSAMHVPLRWDPG